MAHFAELDKDNKVLRVVVGCNTDIANNGGEQSTQAATHFETVVPLSTDGVKWMQTSYNHNFRKQYAGHDFIYDETNDRFLHPKPGAAWTYNTDGDLVPYLIQMKQKYIVGMKTLIKQIILLVGY